MSLIDSASLIVTPNAYKEGTLYSVIPSDDSGDLSVTRATTATRVNSSGLVELVPYNLFSYSEQFNNAYWTKNRSSITANTTTSPNGTLTADSLIENTANGTHEFIAISAAEVQPYTFSIYGKANTRSKIQLVLAGTPFASGGNGEVSFDLSLGTVISAVNGATGTIQNIGNGWYRCTITKAASVADPSGVIAVRLLDASGNSSYTGDGTSSAYFWGAQLNEGSSALDYLPTTDRLDVARIDYSSGSAALLVEPQRTNLALYSSSFDNAYWAKENATITANSVISPDGTQNADTLTDDAVNGRHRFQTYFTGTAGTFYTLSIYVKKNSANRFLLLNAQSILGQKSVLNLDTLQITNLNGASGQVVDAGNGWYRFSVSGTYITASNYYIQMQNSASDVSYVGNGSSFYIWGAQLEAGSYPTSLIPTQGSTVTRNADVISKTGIADLIGTEFTVFLDAYESFGATSRYLVLKGSGGTYANAVLLEANSSNRIVLTVLNNSSSSVFSAQSSVLTSGQRFKLAVRCKNNDFAFYVNGTQVAIQTSGSVPTTSDLYLGYYSDVSDNYNTINSAVIYKTALTNAELATLTTI